MKLFAFLLLALPTIVLGQPARLSATSTKLSPDGGTLVLTATTTYPSQPDALGWAINLPANWTLVAVAGRNLPAVAPDSGATGALEFAYTTVPSDRAEFAVTIRYPAGAGSAAVDSTVYLRAAGKLTTLTPARLELQRSRGKAARREIEP
jgi:hypothetical protein